MPALEELSPEPDLDAPPPAAPDRSSRGEPVGNASKLFMQGMDEVRQHNVETYKQGQATGPDTKPDDKPAPTPQKQKIESGLELPTSIKGKAAENFKKVVADKEEAIKRATEYEKRIADYEAKIKAYETAPPKVDEKALADLQKNFEDTKKEREEYEKIVQQFYVEHDPKFQSAFTSRIQSAIADAKEVAGEKGDLIVEILSGPPSKARDKALKEVSADMDEFDRLRLIQVYDRLNITQKEMKEELNKSSQNYKILTEINAKKAAENAAAAKAKAENAVAQAIAEAEKLDEDKEGAVFRREWVSKALSGNYPDAEALKVPGLAAQALWLKDKVIPALQAQIKERDEQLAKYNGANPGLQGNRTVVPGKAPAPKGTLAMPNEEMPAYNKFMSAINGT